MLKSKKPSKQRKFRINAPLHIKRKFLSAHLSKDLQKQAKRRSIQIRKGDEIKIMRGDFKGTTGKITKVDVKKTKIYLDEVKRRKVSGQEVKIGIEPSNVMITKLDLEDKLRQVKLNKKVM